MNFSILPNLIALAILVGVFWAISKRATTERLRLWLAGWILILLHFAASFFVVSSAGWTNLMTAVSMDTLILAGVAFLISVSSLASTRPREIILALAFGLPCVLYTDAAIWDVSSRTFYYTLIALSSLTLIGLVWRFNRKTWLYASSMSAVVALIGVLTARAVYSGKLEMGIVVLLTALNLVTAFLYWNHRSHATAGVFTAVIGFLLWAAVFPTATLISIFAPGAKVESEVWNIPKYLVAVGMILTLLEDQIERSNYLAYHDELTALPNRRLLDDRLERALANAQRMRSKVAVLLIDLDRFKEVNDTFGHRVGDLALQAVVARLAGRLRAADTLARSGGDEFTVVSVVSDAKGARTLASNLEAALSAPMDIDGLSVQTGLSIGVAMYPEDGSTADQLHAAADKTMYAAKRARSAEMIGAMPN